MLKNLNHFNLPEIEERVLKFWRENQVFEKSLKNRQKSAGRRTFRFFEGPPYANGRPGIHHVLARVFKDIVLRYKTMAGYYAPRRAGWDTHGLPIELEAEKALGIKSKKEIEKFGVALFNQKARESVWRYKEEWEKLTNRIGFWIDLKNAYVTYENNYIESLWWVMKKIYERGFLKQSRKVVPYCPRCQTPLSSHELGQPGVYRKTKDPSVYVKFRLSAKRKAPSVKKKAIRDLRHAPSEYLLVWTTTPWTLPANVAVAVNSRLTYTKYKTNGEYLWSYNPPPHLEGKNLEAVEKISGRKLVGFQYEPLYKILNPKSSTLNAYEVLGADFVSTEEGTGLVHIAPAFGEDDFKLWQSANRKEQNDFPVTVDDSGRVEKGLPGAGKFVKEADKDIIEDLRARNLIYSADVTEHEYPFCWRCGTPLLYFARLSWFIEMSRLRKQLVEGNKKINWIPAYLKEGRFGEWIKEAKDWPISRDRYWGTPLPIWQCEKGHAETIGGLKELNDRRWSKNRFFLMRHGEATANLQKVMAAGPEKGDNVSRLTPKGKKQVEAAARDFIGQDLTIDAIYSSPYKRTKDTAEVFAAAAGFKDRIVVDNRLRELEGGMFNWRPVIEHSRFFKSPLERFSKRPEGGENYFDIYRRIVDFVKDVNRRHHNRNILVISHGDILWLMKAKALDLKMEEVFDSSYPALGKWQEVVFNNWPHNDGGDVDLHRPFADEIYLKCRRCRSRMTRVPGVADVWFDSGAMPWASWHYPFENKKFIDLKQRFPADYIAEGLDQTRGWFYTLLAISVLLDKGAPYHNVISLGLVLDKNGQKMSKSKGNVVDPWQMIEKYGIDVIRWYFYTINPPAEPKRFDEEDLVKTSRKFFSLFYNSYVFYEIYAYKSPDTKYKILNTNVLDKWILARLNETITDVTGHLESYEIGLAAREIEDLVDDLSRWYIRRSRRRFSAAAKDRGHLTESKDYEAASRTLSFVLENIALLTAPFAPFFAEALYKSLVVSHKSSVHLEDWPKANRKLIDKKLLVAMSEIRRLASLALAKRAEAGIKVRQPLGQLKIKKMNWSKTFNKELTDILKDEINVKEIVFDSKLKEEIELDTKITPELKEEGVLREMVRLVQGLRRDAGLEPKDPIVLMMEAPKTTKLVVEKNEKVFKFEIGAEKIEYKKSEKFDAELNSKIEEGPIWLGIRKI